MIRIGKLLLLSVGLGLLLASRAAAADPASIAASKRLSLDGEWRFHLEPDEASADRLGAFHADGFDASAFKPIPVPSNWNMQGFEDPYYVNGTKSEGFYLHTFTVPAEAAGKRALLHFDGVWQSAEVWLNGQRLGRHDSGFTAFAFDVSKALKPGAENRLAVRVRQQTQLFKLDANDDWALAGIYRGVWLELTPKELYLERVEVETDFDRDFRDAELKLRVFVHRDAKADFFAASPPFDVRAILRTGDGQEVQRTDFTGTITGAHNGRDVFLSMLVRSPAPWTAETPHLYELAVELRTGGKLVHAWADRIGFREVSTDGGVLRVNGRAIKLRGVARHEQHPDVGRATRAEHWLEDIRLMKAANINAVRTAHYPPAEGFVRLCDEHGLYVIEEIPFGFGGDRMGDPSYAEGVFLRVHETIARDRNRPSVIIWSVGNEDPLSALHVAALRAVKGLDPTRPRLLPFRADEDLPPEVDILAPHYWKAEDYDRLAAIAKRPIVTTEYTHAVGPDDFGELQERWDALTRHPAGAGGMIWLWADQGLRRPVNGRPVFDPLLDRKKYTREGAELVRVSDAGPNEIYDAHGLLGTDGIVDANRTPQIDYWETKAAYAPVRVLAERVDFVPGQERAFIPVRNDYDFTDLSTVTVAWKLFRDDAVLAMGFSKLPATPPHAEARFELPTTAIAKSTEAGTCYVHLGFTDAQGRELTKRSVRLGVSAPPDIPAAVAGAAPRIEKQGDQVTVVAGDARYGFDSKSGELASLEIGGTKLVDGADLAIWRRPTYSEQNVLDRRKQVYPWRSYLQTMAATAKAWNVSEAPEGVVLTAASEYRYDERNRVTVDYTYRVASSGALAIEYVVKPELDLPWLQEIGLSLGTIDQPQTVTWLGYGPVDTLPNRHGSALFGQWTLPLFSSEARGTKSGVEWLKLNAPGGHALWVKRLPGFRFEADEKGKISLRLLSHLAGAWVKGGPPERPEWRLDLNEGRGEFRGSFELVPVASRDGEDVAHASALPVHPAVVGGGVINEQPSYPSCHASTIVDLGSGVFGAAWFGGTHERHPDVGIWFARFEKGRWLPAVEVANGVQADGKREPTWNPVLFQPKGGPLVLFYKVGPSPSKWWGMVMTSADGGKTWGKPQRLPDGVLGPIKNKPVQLADGAWLSPSSSEGNPTGWRVHFEVSRDAGKTWQIIGPLPKGEGIEFDAIQPSVLFHTDGRLQAVARTRNGVIAETWSSDAGRTWSALAATELPNPNSGTDAVTLADGRQLMVYNHTSPPPERPTKGVRYPLDVAVSDDGVHWRRVLTLENEPRAAGYAYPAVIQAADGRVHITYTWDRKRIKHVVLDPEKL